MSKVLALKYRPSSFDKLVGQESVTSTLSSALNQNRLSHAYLFSGLRGSGKTSTARIFAKALVCNEGPTSTPCEVCENCIMANENRHIDIIEMDAASSRKIDDVRDLIEQTKYMPSIARFKIFIIDEVHMLTKEAFNALLKTLEEPPSYVKFILATTDPLKLPVTILSRTQHFRFKQISKDDTLKHLTFILNQENIKFTDEAIEIVARAGNGSLRDTLTLLDQAIIYSNGDLTASNVATMLGLLDPKGLEEIFEVIFSEDRDKLLQISKDLESYECENIIDELISYLKDRYFEQDPKYSTMICERFLRILSEAKSLLFLNARESFILTLVFFKMIEALNIKKIDERIIELEGKNTQTPLTAKKEEQQTVITPEVPQQPANEPKSADNSLFEQLLIKINDRSAMVGECFEKNVSFESFENNVLTLNSSAQNEAREIIRKNFNTIQTIIKEVFSPSTKLIVTKEEGNKEVAQEEQKMQETKEIVQEEIEVPKDTGEVLFVKLISKIKDKEILVGECFEKNVSFVSFLDDTLTLNSCAESASRETIRDNYNAIKEVVYEIFTKDTKLVVNQIQKEVQKKDITNIDDTDTNLSLFSKLISKIHERDFNLGECFEQNVSLVTFLNNTLTLNSCADSDSRKIIRDNFPIIKQLMQEIFGIETTLVVNQIEERVKAVKIKKDEPKKEEKEEKEEKDMPIIERPFVKEAIKKLAPDN